MHEGHYSVVDMLRKSNAKYDTFMIKIRTKIYWLNRQNIFFLLKMVMNSVLCTGKGTIIFLQPME